MPQSIPRLAWNRARQTGTVLASSGTLAELATVLHRPKIAAYVSPTEAQAFLTELVEQVLLVPIGRQVAASVDPKDNQFLELAVSGGAGCLVTGDRKHLLSLDPYEGIRILTPRQFLELP